ncbi:MAG: NUDIX domain-containing protein [Candidatus Fimadaptatus sp.]
MAIRSVVKALIVRSGSVLLNRCRDAEGRALYDLPGGGQRQHEPMEQALAREVMEETGYTIARARLVALAEEISQDARDRAGYPDYAHRIMHIFAADIRGDVPRGEPSKLASARGAVWLSASGAEEE